MKYSNGYILLNISTHCNTIKCNDFRMFILLSEKYSYKWYKCESLAWFIKCKEHFHDKASDTFPMEIENFIRPSQLLSTREYF